MSMNKAEIENISPYAFDGEELLSIKEQLDLQDDALALTGDRRMAHKPIIVLPDASILGINELEHNAIVLTRQTIKHIFRRHAVDGQEPMSMREITQSLLSLKEELLDYIVAFEDLTMDNTIDFVINKVSRNGNNLIVVIRLHTQMGCIEVNSIRSVHGKSNIKEIIAKVKSSNKKIFETDKTENWLKS